jgi:integrase/recombinase XerD
MRTRSKMAREGVPLNVIQRQVGHANLGITSVYLEGIDNAEIIDTVRARRAPMIPASAGLRGPRCTIEDRAPADQPRLRHCY